MTTQKITLQTFANRRMLICIFIGFSSGLPLFILINLLTAWLRSEGVDLKAIGLFALIGFPYTWKFIWSPLMDRFSIGRLGRRRGWMLTTQILLVGAIAAFGLFDPKRDLWTIAALAALVSFFSASQDIALDAYRREILSDDEQGLGTALHVNAYKLAGLIPGSLSLILSDHLPWSSVFVITALFMLPGIVTTLMVDEPKTYGAPPKTLADAVVLPFREFVRRSGWDQALLVLSFIFLYKLGDSMAVALATPFYLDVGFTRTEIGLIAKNAGLWMSVAGGLIGGVWLIKLGINRGLWVFGVIQAVVILGFAWLAQMAPNKLILGTVIGAEASASGSGPGGIHRRSSRAARTRATPRRSSLVLHEPRIGPAHFRQRGDRVYSRADRMVLVFHLVHIARTAGSAASAEGGAMERTGRETRRNATGNRGITMRTSKLLLLAAALFVGGCAAIDPHNILDAQRARTPIPTFQLTCSDSGGAPPPSSSSGTRSTRTTLIRASTASTGLRRRRRVSARSPSARRTTTISGRS
jgi:PAT family beta-lactamase induction signal transducer AmpG